MRTSSEQVESISLRIGGFAIKLSRARFRLSQGGAPENMVCMSPWGHSERMAQTEVSQRTTDRLDHFPTEGGPA